MGVKLLPPIFHISQVTPMTDEAQFPVAEDLPKAQFSAPRVLDNWKVAGMKFREVDSNRAFFSPFEDYINLPPIGAFESEAGYFGTLFHEATHWTGHEARLQRPHGVIFGDKVYAKEELIAEIGAAMIGAELGLAPVPSAEHASYLASWIKALKADPSILYEAAIEADKATKFLVAFGQVGEMAA